MISIKEFPDAIGSTKFEVGELILLPVEWDDRQCNKMNWLGRKVEPKYAMPYRVEETELYGMAATCLSLCPIETAKGVIGGFI